MTQQEFKTYQFSKSTQVKIHYNYEAGWFTIEGVNFEKEEIETPIGTVGINDIVEIRD